MRAGYAKSGLVPVLPLDSMMEHFGNYLIRPAFEKENNTLVIALNHLVIEEKNNTQYSIGNIYIDADFYLGNNNQYVKVFGLDSLFEFALDNDDPIGTLSKVYSRIFSRLLVSVTGLHVPAGEPTFSMQQVAAMDSTVNHKFPVYHQLANPGIYYTIEEFLNNTPGDTAFIQKHANSFDIITDWFYKTRPGSKKKGIDLTDTTCFAVFNGKKWYRPYKNEFKEMTFKDGHFYYLDKADGLILPSNNNYIMFFPGLGLVGSLAAVAVQTAVYSNIKDKPGKYGDAVFLFKLNPETGAGIRTERLE
jgi:hypothetical protein